MPVRDVLSLLVTVKAYPNISRRRGEVVCVAGIRTDTEQPAWVRLWPVPFRDLAFTSRFKKYQVIKLRASQPAGSDQRPESWTPDVDSIQTGPVLDAKNNWSKRKRYVLPLMLESMCEIQRRQERDGASLGVFRPGEMLDFVVERDSGKWDPDQQAVVDQPSLLFPSKTGLEKIPFRFRYRYRCAQHGCRTHYQSIIDWELAEAYRRWRAQYDADELLRKLREKWLDMMWSPTRDTLLFVGNQHNHPEAFLVLGVFYPAKES
jgi:hypothetical protein